VKKTSPASTDVYHLTEGDAPIMISVPHAGTAFPDELKPLIKERFIDQPEDTDWFVDRLYGFAAELDVTLLTARYSRYVIDLNRDPDGIPLYQDQRVQTAALPVRSFALEPLYVDEAYVPDTEEISRRKKLYYDPYYRQIARQLQRLKERHRHVLLYDGHSIERSVPSINSQDFPDMILGNRDGAACDPSLLNSAKKFLDSTAYSCQANFPFKGGQITRNFGQPADGIHALQMEMSQDIYMDEAVTQVVEEKFQATQETLKRLFAVLLETLQGLTR
jgi:N-formylglutamate amidohydrolase